MLETKLANYFGHVLRRPRSHPQHQVTFAPYLASPNSHLIAETWNFLKNNDDGLPNLNFDHRSLGFRKALIDAARAYRPPFSWSQILVWSISFWRLLCVNELCVKVCVWRAGHEIKYVTICQYSFVERVHKLLSIHSLIGIDIVQIAQF